MVITFCMLNSWKKKCLISELSISPKILWLTRVKSLNVKQMVILKWLHGNQYYTLGITGSNLTDKLPSENTFM